MIWPAALAYNARVPHVEPMTSGQVSSAQKASFRRVHRWMILGAVLLLLLVAYSYARHIVYRRLLYDYAQRILNQFATGTVEKIGKVELTAEGNLILYDAVVLHRHRGKKRTFYRAPRMEIALDGSILRDPEIYVSRIDLFQPELWVVRETGGDWNVVWGFQPPSGTPPPSGPGEAPAPAPHPVRSGWPHNGVHVHNGIVHVTFVRDSGAEVTWDITSVHTSMMRAHPGVRFGPMRGEFYGGTFRADATVSSFNPFIIDLQVSVKGADVARLAEGAPFLKHPVSGTLDGVVALTGHEQTIGERPLAAGRIEIRDGNLWDLPAFVGILATLSLTEVGNRRLEAANIEFTVERDRVRIDQMDFLGTPMCLFGDGTMTLTGDELDILLVPQFGKSMNDVFPILGAPLQWLLDIAKGALVPVRITGPFWAPKINVVEDEEVSEPVKKLIEEKAPK